MQKINQEAFSFLQSYDMNFVETQQQLDRAETELERLQILFKAVASLSEGSYDTELLEKANTLAQKAHQSFTSDTRSLSNITATFDSIISKTDQNREFNQLLDSWDASEEVKDKVRECRKTRSKTLALSNKGLSSFPSSLLKHLPYVKNLNLSNNQLTSFRLEGSSELQQLFLSHNSLTSFSLEGASELQNLNLSHNLLTSFSLGGASQLQTLTLFNNRLNSFSLEITSQLQTLDLSKNYLESFNLERASELQTLSLFDNQLTFFNLEITSQLETLELSKNNLTSFRLVGALHLQILEISDNNLESFSLVGASQVQTLDLSSNFLTSFSLEETSELVYLYLSENELTSFTLEGAFHLQELHLDKNQLTQEPLLLNCAVPEIFNLSENPYLTNPLACNKNIVQQRLALFTALLKSSTPEKENLKKLSADQIFAVLEEENPLLIPHLSLWLEKLQTARDFKDLTNREEFAYNVLSIIDFALKTPEFREPLALALEQANSSCVDRCSLFLNEAIQAKKTYELGVMPIANAITFLKGSYALKIIHNLATEFVESRRIRVNPHEYYNPNEVVVIDGIAYRDTLDPIEVYIDLQCRLKDDFSLPIVIKEQNYQSSVTPEFEGRVRENVQMALKDTPSLTDYFCSLPSWIEKIKREYGEELQIGFDEINADMEKFMRSEKFTNATEDEQKTLVLSYQEQARKYSEEFPRKKTKDLLNLK